MTTTARKPAPRRKPAVGAVAAEAVEMPGTVTALDREWDPEFTPIGHTLAVEWLAKAEVPAAS